MAYKKFLRNTFSFFAGFAFLVLVNAVVMMPGTATA